MLFKSKDKIDNLIDQQNRKINRKQKLKDTMKMKLSKLENKIDKLTSKSWSIKRMTDYKVKCLEFEIEELGNLITLKACTNAKKKSLIEVQDVKD